MLINHAETNMQKCVEFENCSLFAGSEPYLVTIFVVAFLAIVFFRKYDFWYKE